MLDIKPPRGKPMTITLTPDGEKYLRLLAKEHETTPSKVVDALLELHKKMDGDV